MKHLEKLFAAHHPSKDFLVNNCKHFYCDVLSIAETIQSPDRVTLPYSHAHEEYEFNLPITPVPVLVNEGAVFFGEVGFAYPVQSNHQHGTSFRVSDIAQDHVVIQKEYLDEMMDKKNLTGTLFSGRFEVTRDLKSYIQLFKHEFEKNPVPDNENLLHLAALISSTIIELGIYHVVPQQKETWSYQKGVSEVAAYMNQHFQDNLSIDQLASMCGLTKNYFISAFKRSMGETPYSYLSKLRISKAKILLETTDLSIQEVAAECGFQKANTLTTLFKNNTTMTPSQYRSSLKK